jgi:16S rRNA (adenine1518-N6/adenine1519-N6)-dimethyltransferase
MPCMSNFPLEQVRVRPTKERGQNFVSFPYLLEEFVAFAKISEEVDAVVEIGPGLGALTEVLASHCQKKNIPLYFIEVEERFCSYLSQKFPQCTCINADVREVDFTEIGKRLHVVGNLPYSITSEILFLLLNQNEANKIFNKATFLVQKEFAQRIGAVPGTKAFGVPTVLTQVVAGVELGEIFDGTCFYPQTEVDSQLMNISFLSESLVPHELQALFELLVRTGFSRRRKKMRNVLIESKLFFEESLDKALELARIAPSSRAEQISPLQYVVCAKNYLDLVK